jgi:hypothetical protein
MFRCVSRSGPVRCDSSSWIWNISTSNEFLQLPWSGQARSWAGLWRQNHWLYRSWQHGCKYAFRVLEDRR